MKAPTNHNRRRELIEQYSHADAESRPLEHARILQELQRDGAMNRREPPAPTTPGRAS